MVVLLYSVEYVFLEPFAMLDVNRHWKSDNHDPFDLFNV